MSSRKVRVHDFVKRYFARWGTSPTLGEIGAGCGITRTHAHRLIHELADEKMIELAAGKARGIRLRERSDELSEADALVLLSELGWTIGDGNKVINPRGLAAAFPMLDHPDVTDSRLLPFLDHSDDRSAKGESEGMRGEIDENEAEKPRRRARRRAKSIRKPEAHRASGTDA